MHTVWGLALVKYLKAMSEVPAFTAPSGLLVEVKPS
jgi:hypothetical protein